MGKRTNSNIHCTVTDGPFAMQVCQRCTFDPKKKSILVPEGIGGRTVADAAIPIVARPPKHRKTLLRVMKNV